MKVLLISYTFPPTPGIGGRRWAKFVKCLSKEGVEFHVIYSKDSLVPGNLWINDLKGINSLNRYPVNLRWSKILANTKLNFINKIIYKLFFLWAKHSKFNPYDNTAFAKNQIVNLACKIIKKEKIDALIVTGAPFNLLYFGALIKEKTGVKLILDYRDLWNGHPTFSVFQRLSRRQLDYSLHQEKTALKKADLVFAVNNGLKNDLITLNEGDEVEKFKLIYNGFDKDDFYLDISKKESEQIRVIFAGNIDMNLSDLVLDFMKSFKQLKSNNYQVYKRIKLMFYLKTNDPELQNYLDHQEDKNTEIHYNFLPKEEYYKKLRSTDVGIFFLSAVYSNAFITKFSDFIVNENFVVQVGYEGDCAQYLRENGIGMTYHIGDGPAFFEKLAQIDFKNRYEQFDPSDFDLKKISQEVKRMIESI